MVYLQDRKHNGLKIGDWHNFILKTLRERESECLIILPYNKHNSDSPQATRTLLPSSFISPPLADLDKYLGRQGITFHRYVQLSQTLRLPVWRLFVQIKEGELTRC